VLENLLQAEIALDLVVCAVHYMKLGFDIFRRLEDGSPLWIAQVNSVAEARIKLQTMRQFSPGHYFVRDAETGQSLPADEDENPREIRK
jgi:hypothetical protein